MDTTEGITKTVSPQELAGRIASILAEHFQPVLTIAGVPRIGIDTASKLAARARLISDTFQATALHEHPLRPFFSAALTEMAMHADAADKLFPSRAAVLHARQLEELATTAKFLVSQVGSYDDFAWRWREFKTIHAIRNRIHNLKKPLDPVMQDWVDQNLERLKKIDKKFTGAVAADESVLKRFNNWLYPISLREIFEKAGVERSYFFQQYEWSSHSVHLSPLGEAYEGFQLSSGMSFVEFMMRGSMLSVDGMARTASHLVVDHKRMRSLHVALVLLSLHATAETDPQSLAQAAESGRIRFAVGEIMRDPPNIERLAMLLVGEAPENPLLIKSGGPAVGSESANTE